MPEREPSSTAAGKLVPYLLLAFLVLILDLGTKALVEAYLRPGQVIYVAPFFNLVLTYNPGAAFSLLSDAAGWQRWLFSGIAVAASVLIVHLLRRHSAETLFCVALALILGGALGNLRDRIAIGEVVDFIQLHYAGYYWPAFNLADSAITVGAVLIVWDGLRGKTKT
ncbi:MAG: lipoprotein signal peptidase [Betaproteobacteria bacterium]|nr:lipoprotein signal peptidase [Betaproteobacteria bacterium]